MTSTRAINAAAGVIHAAMQQGKTLPASIAYVLDSACLLNSPEAAAELVALRARVAELSPGPCRNASPYGRRCDQPSGHDGDHGMADGAGGHFGWPATDDVSPESLHASSGAVIDTTRTEDVRPQVADLRALLARQPEGDGYVSPLHRDYRTPHDLPEARS